MVKNFSFFMIMIIVIIFSFSGCAPDDTPVLLDANDTNSNNELTFEEPTGDIELNYSSPDRIKSSITSDFVPLTNEQWTDKEVRKVLNTFTYGATATEAQIKLWADMKPIDAINEIMDLNTTNLKVKNIGPSFISDRRNLEDLIEDIYRKYDDLDMSIKGVYDIGAHFASGYVISDLIVDNTNYNPFRIRLGLWETNYHQVINSKIDNILSINVYHYFDDIVNGIQEGMSYQDILSRSASSTPIMYMYKQFDNKYINGELTTNDDFAREYNQLFFGILGKDNLSYYENVTVENTANVLTGMTDDYQHTTNEFGTSWGPAYYVTPTSYHYNQSVELLFNTIANEDVIKGLQEIADIAINNDESERTLPLIIIGGLADDNLDENINKKETIINAWKLMDKKDLLYFLKKYAISRCFHSSDRIRYLSSPDRVIKIFNLLNFEGKTPNNPIKIKTELDFDNFTIFEPAKGVFGNYTGLDIKDNSNTITNTYNKAIHNDYNFLYPSTDYRNIIDFDISDKIKEIAEYLWNKMIGDNLKHFGILERAEVYSLLLYGKDLNTYFNIDTELTDENFKNDSELNKIYLDMENSTIDLTDDKYNNNIRDAINFILGTPYILFEEGV